MIHRPGWRGVLHSHCSGKPPESKATDVLFLHRAAPSCPGDIAGTVPSKTSSVPCHRRATPFLLLPRKHRRKSHGGKSPTHLRICCPLPHRCRSHRKHRPRPLFFVIDRAVCVILFIAVLTISFKEELYIPFFSGVASN